MNNLMMDPELFKRRFLKLRSGNIYMDLVNVHGIQVKDGQLSIRTDKNKPITLDIAQYDIVPSFNKPRYFTPGKDFKFCDDFNNMDRGLKWLIQVAKGANLFFGI